MVGEYIAKPYLLIITAVIKHQLAIITDYLMEKETLNERTQRYFAI